MQETIIKEHFKELKYRFSIILLTVFVASSFSYLFVEEIYGFLIKPLAEIDSINGLQRRMIFTGLTEAFFTYIKLAIFGGVFISFPVVAYQIYRFVAPGLYKNERRFLLPVLLFSPIFFITGALFVYYFLFPMAWEFFISFESASVGGSQVAIQLEAKISEYLSLVINLVLAFGLAFQLPVVIYLLVMYELVSIDSFRKSRKYALILVLCVAAIITPPDVISQLSLAVPLYLLYEGTLILLTFMKK